MVKWIDEKVLQLFFKENCHKYKIRIKGEEKQISKCEFNEPFDAFPDLKCVIDGKEYPIEVEWLSSHYNHFNHPVESAKRELEKTIKNIQKGKLEIDTPISVAIELRAFKESEKPLENSIGEMLEIISTINNRMSNLDNKFGILKNIEDKITNPSSSGLFGTYRDSIEDYEIVHDPLENKYRFKKKSGWLV